MYRLIEQLLKVLKMLTLLGAVFLSNWLLNEVSPLDETASARQLKFSALSGLETSQPRPVMAGLTETEARRGMKLTYHWDKGFPRSPEGARTSRGQ